MLSVSCVALVIDVEGQIAVSVAVFEVALVGGGITGTRSRTEAMLASLHKRKLGAQVTAAYALCITSEVALESLIKLTKFVKGGHCEEREFTDAVAILHFRRIEIESDRAA